MKNAVQMISIFAITIFIPLQCMETTKLTLMDKKKDTFPIQNITYSNTLYTRYLQCLTSPHQNNTKKKNISIPEVSALEFAVYKRAREEKFENFTTFFNTLNPEQKRMLLNVAGESKLYDIPMTISLIKTLLPADILTKIQRLWTQSMVSHLTHESINKHIQEKSNYTDIFDKIEPALPVTEYGVPYIDDNSALLLPVKQLVERQVFRKKHWRVYDKKQYDSIQYLITNSHTNNDGRPAIKKNIRRLWIIKNEHVNKQIIVISKKIYHDTPIELIAFSNDGAYIAIGSQGPENNLQLISVTTHENFALNFLPFLIGHTNPISALCFNNQSTILASGEKNNKTIILWDMNGNIIHKLTSIQSPLPAYEGQIEENYFPTKIIFNSDDSQLFIFFKDDQKIYYARWNINPLKEACQCILLRDHHYKATNITYLHKTNYILFIHRNAHIIRMSATSGQTEPIKDYCATCIVLSEDEKFFLTAYETSITLWNTKTMLPFHVPLEGVIPTIALCRLGFSADMRYILVTHRKKANEYLIQLELFDNATVDTFAWLKDNSTNLARIYQFNHMHSIIKGGNIKAYNAHAQCTFPDSTEIIPVPKVVKTFLDQVEPSTNNIGIFNPVKKHKDNCAIS